MADDKAGPGPLMVVLCIADTRYAIPARLVLEVLPWLPSQPVPLAPPAIHGLINYRGTVVPIVDLCRVLHDRACSCWLASRIVIVTVGLTAQRMIGLFVEACDLLQPDTFSIQPGLRLSHAAFLGDLLADGDDIVQLFRPDALLDDDLLEMLTSTALTSLAVKPVPGNSSHQVG